MSTCRVRSGSPIGSASLLALLAGLCVALPAMPAIAQPPMPPGAPGGGPGGEENPFPPFAEVTKGFERVVSTADGSQPMYTLWRRERDQRLLAELPRDFERQRIFIATTIAGGAPNTGIQLGDQLAYWRRYDRRLALMEPNVGTKASGDAESKRTEEKLYTDRVVLDLPILTMGPGGGPVIDLSGLLVGQSDRFFGSFTAGGNKQLYKLSKVKAFPRNVEIAIELPNRFGTLTTIHYSVSVIPDRGNYRPREADPRVGYFHTAFRDISRQDRDTQWVRYVNRWNLEKRDPSLRMSPPKEPVVFYIEATTPVKYRRWVREGVLAWNKAFEKIGYIDAIQVMEQDATTGANMDKDPEDARYNFIRWSSADLGFAIGPSRVHPETGQILDADVVIDDGFIRGWFRSYTQLIGELAMAGYGHDTIAWFDKNPQWDPRLRLAEPAEREQLLKERQIIMAQPTDAGSLDPMSGPKPPPGRGGIERSASPIMGLRSGAPLAFQPVGPASAPDDIRNLRCSANLAKSIDVAMMRLGADELLLLTEAVGAEQAGKQPEEKKDEKKDDKKDEKKEPKEQMLDGLPESFVGPLLADLVAHEVGHTLGLRHNFKASSIATLEQINSADWKGKKTITGSVMDYNPINVNFKDGPVQGDWSMIGVGPYDMWAIEFGYGDEKDRKAVLGKVADADLPFGTDEDISGPDPLIKMFDLGKDSLAYSESSMRIVQFLRPKIMEKIVKDGDSWQRARDAFNLLLARHVGSVRIAAYYIGGANVNRDRKGDPGNRPAITPTPADQQRRALKFILDNTFKDEAFGLNRELLSRMTVDKWWDGGGMGTVFQDPAWQIHDRILGIQSAALTMIMNPTTLQRVYDNEFRVAPDQDALTLPEMLDTVSKAVWTELEGGGGRKFTARDPMISSLRRNLQREYVNRLIDLATSDSAFNAAYKPISNLVVMKLREQQAMLKKASEGDSLDPYSKAHLAEAAMRIEKALNAEFIYNADKIGGGMGGFFFFGQPGESKPVGPGAAPYPPFVPGNGATLAPSTPGSGGAGPSPSSAGEPQPR